MDLGLLILRLIVGGYLFGHGAQKLFGWFGGAGMKGSEQMTTRLGFRPHRFWAWVAALTETGSGLLLALGFLSPLGSFGIVAVMTVATVAVHWRNGLWNTNRGVELTVTNLAAAVALATTGPGRYSLDALFGISLPEPVTAMVVAGLLALGLAVGFATRKPTLSGQPQSARPA